MSETVDGKMRDSVFVRLAREGDAETITELTGQVFAAASIDAKIEEMIGGTPWLVTKGETLRNELKGNPAGCFVAELGGEVVGYITTIVNRTASRGVIANIAVSAKAQGRGVGRLLLAKAIEHFRALGLRQAKIETLATNAAGEKLYTSIGFKEVARQIHFCMPL